jgi:glutamate/tyrosine decarboxylase-like PLP-dependent enzyme
MARVTVLSDMTDRAELIRHTAQRAADYLLTAPDRPVAPSSDHLALLDTLPTALPSISRDPGDVIALLDRVGSATTMVQTHGRYFGFVNGGTDPAGHAAAMLAGVWDQNVALPVMSPIAAHLDAQACEWIVELLGLPLDSVATFCGGASLANLTAIVTARDELLRRAGWSVAADGLVAAPALRAVVSAEVHVSVLKALRVAGIGRNATVTVPTDAEGRLDAAHFPEVDERTLVVMQAGNVNTGHSDPFGAVIPRVHDAGGWVHVDGAFGLWAAVSPTRRHLLAGVELADSWATDAHKWLNAPYDAGILICRREDDLRRAMAVDAAYLQTDSQRALMHLSLQMSQAARAVPTWAIIAANGREGIASMVDRTCDLAARFAASLRAHGAELLATPVINQALVAFGDDQTTDAVIAAVQAEGVCWVGGTTWKGRRAMRLSVSDRATTEADVDAAVASIVRCWERRRVAG